MCVLSDFIWCNILHGRKKQLLVCKNPAYNAFQCQCAKEDIKWLKPCLYLSILYFVKPHIIISSQWNIHAFINYTLIGCKQTEVNVLFCGLTIKGNAPPFPFPYSFTLTSSWETAFGWEGWGDSFLGGRKISLFVNPAASKCAQSNGRM